MWINQRKATAALFVLAGVLAGTGRFVLPVLAEAPPVLAQSREETNAPPPVDKDPRPSKLDLTPQSWPKLHALIRPHDNEWRHLRVHWLTDPVVALKTAATEDKPIVYLYLGGAGYNAPLGAC